MKTSLLGAAAALAIGAVAFSGGAQAQCMWNGFNWSCASAPPVYYSAPVYSGNYYTGWPGYTYPYAEYKPEWLPSYPGPRPSSGAGR